MTVSIVSGALPISVPLGFAGVKVGSGCEVAQQLPRTGLPIFSCGQTGTVEHVLFEDGGSKSKIYGYENT